jgi:hypothetical protein
MYPRVGIVWAGGGYVNDYNNHQVLARNSSYLQAQASLSLSFFSLSVGIE